MSNNEGFPLPQDEGLNAVTSGNWELARPAGVWIAEETDVAAAAPENPSDTPEPSTSSE